jgi:hypothetical protein
MQSVFRKMFLFMFSIIFSVSAGAQEKTLGQKILDKTGLGYFIFWDGHNLHKFEDVTTNKNGPTSLPINTYNLISFKYKLTDKLYLDAQTGTQWFQTQVPRFYFDRVRVGISGQLWKSGDWSLDGAFNSDLPYTGYTAEQRRLLFSPGLFSGLSWKPSNSRFSLYALVQPRVWFYTDREAVEPEWEAAGWRPGQKFESIIQFTPTVNYALTDKFGLRSGIGIDYRKTVENEWDTWLRWQTPLSYGVTYAHSKHLNVYTFLQSFPFDGQGFFDGRTTSIGMWLSGTIY